MSSALPRKRLHCLGPSQWPTIPDGSTIEIEARAPREIVPGDIVVFQLKKMQVCHRVIGVKKEDGKHLFLLKGDAKVWVDGWISEEDLVGKVVTINGRSIDALTLRTMSYFFLWHSRLQWRLFDLLFLSKTGRKLSELRKKFIDEPIFMDLFSKGTAPWLLGKWTTEEK